MRRHSLLFALALASALASAAIAATPRQDAKPADDDAPKAAASLADLAKDVNNKNALEAIDWAHFLGNGCKGAADGFAAGDQAEASRALAGAIEGAVKTAIDAIAGKKIKVKLNDAVEGPVTKAGEAGLTVVVNKAEALVGWADVDPKNLAILIAKGKPTDEPAQAAMATLKLLNGEPGDAKKQATKLGGDLGKRLGELVDAWKSLQPELKSARALESALRDADAARALDKLKAAWPEAKETQLGAQLKKRLHEQYVARGAKAFAGKKALDGLIHGKSTVNPAKASPAAGAGGVGLEIEYEFEKDSEGADFDCASLPRFLQSTLRNIGRGGGAPEPFKVTQSRLRPTGVNGGILPIEFAGDLEIESIGGLNEDWGGKPPGFFSVGATTDDGHEQLFMNDQSVLETFVGGKPGPTAEKKFDKKDIHPGMQVDTVLRLASGKVTLSLNGDATTPVDFACSKPMRVFALAAVSPDWYIERLVIRGTATGASMAALARILADRQATALMGE